MDIEQIPSSWVAATIGSLVEPKVSQDGPDSLAFDYIDISSIDNVGKRIVEPKNIPATDAPSRARQRVQTGDVLVSMTRPNLNAVAMVGLNQNGAIASTGFDILRPIGEFNDWLFSIVRSYGFVSRSLQNSLCTAGFAFGLIPAPPLCLRGGSSL